MMAEGGSRARKRRSRPALECGHCGLVVSKSTYYRHKQKFYNSETKKWKRWCDGDSSDSIDSFEDEREFEFDEVTEYMENYLPSPRSVDKSNLEEEDQEFYSSSSDDSPIQIDDSVVEYWSQSSDDEDNKAISKREISPSLKMLYLFILLWQATYQISNAAIASIIRFLKYFLLILGRAYQCRALSESAEILPVSLPTVYRLLDLNEGDMFTVYVVCPKCDSLYEYQDCIKVLSDGTKESSKCCHITMPNHPHRSRRIPCDTLLMKKQQTKKGTNFAPIKAYPYRSLKKSMKHLLNKVGFVEKCEHWRKRATVIPEEYLGDVYDGNVWRQFNSCEHDDFLSVPYSYLLTLNIDWFQPFTHSVYSTGAIYLTIQNLPRRERYKIENVILVGVMPGPKEPKLTVNGYITPLVEELKEFWDGVVLPVQVHGTILQLRVRLALSCIACDIPASRKVCGFLGHAALLGCNKCLKKFERVEVPGGHRTDFSGYDYQNWELRSIDSHRKVCHKMLQECNTITSLHHAESQNGVRYSVLLALPYFDPIRFTVIDPMHNLFLGSGKHTFKIWIEKGYLKLDNLQKIEDRCKLFHVPADVGRLPTNIASGYGSFTANQWCNWITIYSPVVLKDILPDNHLRCWLLFVRACSILRSRIIKRSDIVSAKLYLVEFCREFERLYGANSCTPNMHLHLHLESCLLDYGPVHSFWCYAFERFNGVLGSMQTNRKSIECQLMKRFCREQELNGISFPDDETFLALLPGSSNDRMIPSSVFDDDEKVTQYLKLAHLPLDRIESFSLTQELTLLIHKLPPLQDKVFSSSKVQELQCIYRQLYPDKQITHMPAFYQECGRINIAGDVIGSTKRGPNSASSSVIMAFWPGSGDSLAAIDYGRMRVGVIQYYFQHSVTLTSTTCTPETLSHLFCYVHWKKLHPQADWCGVSATLCTDLYETPTACSFLPVQRIGFRCAYATLSMNFMTHKENVFVACPIPVKYSI